MLKLNLNIYYMMMGKYESYVYFVILYLIVSLYDLHYYNSWRIAFYVQQVVGVFNFFLRKLGNFKNSLEVYSNRPW